MPILDKNLTILCRPITLDDFAYYLSRGYIVGFQNHQSFVKAMRLILDARSLPLVIDSYESRQECVDISLQKIERMEQLNGICYKIRNDGKGCYIGINRDDFFDNNLGRFLNYPMTQDLCIRGRIFIECPNSIAVIQPCPDICTEGLLQAVFEE